MKASELQHGDVLVYSWRKNASFMARVIRLITGNKVTHCSVVVEYESNKFILEQMGERMHSFLPLYYAMDGEKISCMRPKFIVPPASYEIFYRKPYGYLCTLDAMVNHFLGLFSNKPYKPRLVNWFKSTNVDCSILVGTVLKLNENAEWCKCVEVIEPDDYIAHPEHFEDLGEIEWGQ